MALGFKVTRDELLKDPRLPALPVGEYAVEVTKIMETGAEKNFVAEYKVLASTNDEVDVGGMYKFFISGKLFEESKARLQKNFIRACFPDELRKTDSELLAMDEEEGVRFDAKVAKFMKDFEAGKIQPRVGVTVVEQVGKDGEVKTNPDGVPYTRELFSPLEE